jgi:iron complex transport system ATP-binding protein
MYDLCGVTFRRGSATLVRDASLHVETGTFCAILGPNGAGKSTLLRLLAADLVPSEGTVLMQGRDLRTFGADELAGLRSVLSQTRAVSFSFRVRDVVALGRYRFVDATGDDAAIDRALREVGALELAVRRYDSLSGGEAVRADIARILAQESQVVLLDEPTNHLDPRHQYETLHTIHRLTARGVTVVAVLHDFNAASHFADQVVLMHRGAIAAQGTPGKVLEPALIESVFGLPCAIAAAPNGRSGIIPVSAPVARRRIGTT